MKNRYITLSTKIIISVVVSTIASMLIALPCAMADEEGTIAGVVQGEGATIVGMPSFDGTSEQNPTPVAPVAQEQNEGYDAYTYYDDTSYYEETYEASDSAADTAAVVATTQSKTNNSTKTKTNKSGSTKNVTPLAITGLSGKEITGNALLEADLDAQKRISAAELASTSIAPAKAIKELVSSGRLPYIGMMLAGTTLLVLAAILTIAFISKSKKEKRAAEYAHASMKHHLQTQQPNLKREIDNAVPHVSTAQATYACNVQYRPYDLRTDSRTSLKKIPAL